MFKKSVLFTIIFSFFVSFCFAKGKETKKDERCQLIERAFYMASGSQNRILKIGLVDCVLYSLKGNSEILIKKIDPKLSADDIKIAQSAFEPTFTAEYDLEDSTEQAASTLLGATTSYNRDINLNAGVNGKFITGTEYEFDFNNERYKSNSSFQSINPYYLAEPKIVITQPLFKGCGVAVNSADITIASNNKIRSDFSFTDTVMDTITKTKNIYFGYAYFLEKYQIDKLALERAESLLEINKARYAKGMVSSVDLLETEADCALKRKNLIAAESLLRKAEDELKFITNLVDDPEVWNAKIELLDKIDLQKVEPEIRKAINDAFSNRPDYKSAQLDLKNRDIKVMVAKNNLLPTVDLVGSFGLNGLDKSYQKALEQIGMDKKTWGIGLQFSLPWGTGDRAKLDQRKLEKAQALLEFKRLEQKIVLDVRDKVRDVDIQLQQVEVSKIYKEKETENYLAQKERYFAGQVSTHDMLDYQNKLSQAELDFIKSLTDYNISLAKLDKSEGLTLAKNNIKLEE